LFGLRGIASAVFACLFCGALFARSLIVCVSNCVCFNPIRVGRF
jgi:hypothetical protein